MMTLNSSEFTTTTHALGYNIYLLQVPIVSEDVLITATGVLRQQGATIVSNNAAIAASRTGPIASGPAPVV